MISYLTLQGIEFQLRKIRLNILQNGEFLLVYYSLFKLEFLFLKFRHEIQLWDMCICPKTGAVISAGADGRLQVSLNGRLAAVGSGKDFLFSACRVVLTLVRKSEEVPLEKVCL